MEKRESPTGEIPLTQVCGGDGWCPVNAGNPTPELWGVLLAAFLEEFPLAK